ncbi:MAG: class I SAM-dependent methyltransferase [Acidimicrobiia bacterium]
MNPEHDRFLASDEWRLMLEQVVLPFTLDELGYEDLGADVLEVGPGPGLTTDLVRVRVPALTAIELEEYLASPLQARLAGTNVEVIQADATAMPFEDERFTAAVSFTMLHHVPTADGQDQVLREVRRVLRPGGLFVASDSLASEALADFHAGDVYNPIDPDGLAGRLVAAGFTDVDVRTNPMGWACHARRPN